MINPDFKDSAVAEKFASYPKEAKAGLLSLRTLIYKTAKNMSAGDITESLKWGEPTFATKIGSPIRMDWKEKNPEKIAIYFNCNTKLVDTFRTLYPEVFEFEKNRAIHLKLGQALPETELTHCIDLALSYKKCKHLDLLGAIPRT